MYLLAQPVPNIRETLKRFNVARVSELNLHYREILEVKVLGPKSEIVDLKSPTISQERFGRMHQLVKTGQAVPTKCGKWSGTAKGNQGIVKFMKEDHNLFEDSFLSKLSELCGHPHSNEVPPALKTWLAVDIEETTSEKKKETVCVSWNVIPTLFAELVQFAQVERGTLRYDHFHGNSIVRKAAYFILVLMVEDAVEMQSRIATANASELRCYEFIIRRGGNNQHLEWVKNRWEEIFGEKVILKTPPEDSLQKKARLAQAKQSLTPVLA